MAAMPHVSGKSSTRLPFRYNTPAMNFYSDHSITGFVQGKACDLFNTTIHTAIPVLIGIMLIACGRGPVGNPDELIPGLKNSFLLSDTPIEAPLSTQEFTPPESGKMPLTGFTGILSLVTGTGQSNIEILTDIYSIGGNQQLKLTELPPFSFEFVTDGDEVIPLLQTPQRSSHPYWEIILSPGSAWSESGDGNWSRAALPFTLKEKNQNCLHNGLMTFLYRGDGSISRVAWQVTSETCLYLKINIWGSAEAKYVPQPVPRSAEVIAAYRMEVSRRLPTRPLSDLTLDYPGLELAAFQPPGLDDMSVYGLVLNGINYRSDCPTRYGPYPFCDVLSLPSYSLAKSLVGDIAYQLLISRWPEFATTPVSGLIPECKTGDGRWDDVTPAHLLDMTTGNYESDLSNTDESATRMDTFFLAQTHDGKIRFSCTAWPRKSTPGTQWVYHTTDTYLLGVAMNTFLRQKLGPQADMYRDLLYPQVYEPLGLSPTMRWTQRTYDKEAQPFTGYGLVFHADDAIRLAQALSSSQATFEQPTQISPDKPRLPSDFLANTMPGAKGIAYKEGFWGADASPWIACTKQTWISFMVGYGGITVAILPNGGIYYYFTDSGKFGFRKAAVEANKALNYCKE